jgi:hypothetical protein
MGLTRMPQRRNWHASGSGSHQRLYNIDASDASNTPNIVVPASHMDVHHVHIPGWWETCVYKHASAAGCNKLDSIDPTLCDKVRTAMAKESLGDRVESDPLLAWKIGKCSEYTVALK